MPHFYTPHSEKWFEALKRFDPQQAAHAEKIISLAGSKDVCTVCGDDPAKDYHLVDSKIPDKAVATLRLCEDCLSIRRTMNKENLIELPDPGSPGSAN